MSCSMKIFFTFIHLQLLLKPLYLHPTGSPLFLHSPYHLLQGSPRSLHHLLCPYLAYLWWLSNSIACDTYSCIFVLFAPYWSIYSFCYLLDSTLSSPTPITKPHDSRRDELHLPIALRKDTRTCTQHPIAHFVSYERLSPTYYKFSLAMSCESLAHKYHEALQVPQWKAAWI